MALKLTIEPCQAIETVDVGAGVMAVARWWQGHDEEGVHVHCLMLMVEPQSDAPEVAERYTRELAGFEAMIAMLEREANDA